MLLILDIILWVAIGTSIAWAVFRWIVKMFDHRAQKQINSVSNVLEATRLKKRLIQKRKRALAIYFGAVFLFHMLVCWASLVFTDAYSLSNGIRFFMSSAAVIIVLISQLKYQKSRTDLYGNISYVSVDEYLEQYPHFYLYLRGFDDDTPLKEARDTRENKFQEAKLAEAVEYGTGVPLCALGMTKEVDSPIGATRVYVDDAEWQEKVLLLMHKAEKIFILINNRESCLWEIERAKAMKDKIVFIVDSLSRYVEVKGLFAQDYDMPEAPNHASCFFFENGSKAIPFEATKEGYLSVLGLSMEKIEASKVEDRKEQLKKQNVRDLKIGAIVVAIILVIVLIIVF